MANKKYEIIHRESLFQGYFRVDRYHLRQELYSGGWSDVFTREVFEGNRTAACVLLFDPQQDKIILIEEFRSGPMTRGDDPFMMEIVAGVVNPGETVEQTARREAQEEAGCTVTDLQKIVAFYTSPGAVSEHATLFVGRTTAPEDGAIHGLAHEGEDIKVIVLDAAQAINLLYTGKLKNATAIIAMQWFSLHHTELRSRWLMSDTSTMII